MALDGAAQEPGAPEIIGGRCWALPTPEEVEQACNTADA
jgi:hypothetical protein